MGNQWYAKKWAVVSLHVLFWTLFFLAPYLLRPVMESSAHAKNSNWQGFYYLHFINSSFRLALFYANAYIFIPKLAYRKKNGPYLLVLTASLITMLLWDKTFFQLFLPGVPYQVWNFFVFNLFPFFFIMITSAAYRVIRDKILEDRRNKERETENLKTELSFLRSQVSPHFMFNVLNNMVALARKRSDALEPSLIKLSSLLRYMLYETDEDKVQLEKEVDYLQSYIDLQKQRFGKNVLINASFNEMEHGHTIEPMLLIPFVENAFKHGTGLIANAQIDIDLTVHHSKLQFSVKNRYNDITNDTKDKTSGIGLNNVKRRLNLLYSNNYSLHMTKEDGWFTVLLQLNLH